MWKTSSNEDGVGNDHIASDLLKFPEYLQKKSLLEEQDLKICPVAFPSRGTTSLVVREPRKMRGEEQLISVKWCYKDCHLGRFSVFGLII